MEKTHLDSNRMRRCERNLDPGFTPSSNLVQTGITGWAYYEIVLRDLLQLDETAHRIAGLCADAEPVLDAIRIQLQFRGLF